MSTFCCAFAYAIELSLATLSAAARFTGAATFALISDMAARSGSSSPAGGLRSSCVRWRCSPGFLPTLSSLVALVDGGRLRSVGVRDRAVREDVRRDGRVHGDRDVRVDQRHRSPLRQLLARELRELLAGQLLVVG